MRAHPSRCKQTRSAYPGVPTGTFGTSKQVLPLYDILPQRNERKLCHLLCRQKCHYIKSWLWSQASLTPSYCPWPHRAVAADQPQWIQSSSCENRILKLSDESKIKDYVKQNYYMCNNFNLWKACQYADEDTITTLVQWNLSITTT